MLSVKYFKPISEININKEDKFVLYQSNYCPLVLKSKYNERPLMCLFFVDMSNSQYKPKLNYKSIITKVSSMSTTSSSLSLSSSLLTKKPVNQFEISFGNDNRKCGIIMTNLCNDGYIQVDLTNEREYIQSTEQTTSSINKINEIRPLETIEVISDYSHNEREMILSSDDGTGKYANSNEFIKIKNNIYVNVVPEKSEKKFTDYFENTYWSVQKYFIVHHKINENKKIDLKIFNIVDTYDNLYDKLYEPLLFNKKDKSFPSVTTSSLSFLSSPFLTTITGYELTKPIANGMIKFGKQIELTTTKTNISYNYALPSPRCILGFSIIDGVTFTDMPVIKKDEAKEILSRYVTSLKQFNVI